MIANVRPWSKASPEDRRYNNFLVDRTMLYKTLPISDAARTFLTEIFSPLPEHRPSLAAIREKVLAMDTFFLSPEKELEWKATKLGTSFVPASRHLSEETSSGSYYSGTSESSSSSASCYSSGSSSSAFDSTSSESEWSILPITPPARAVEVFRTVSKAPSRLDLGLPIAVA
jgi:hypothetical protein